MEYLDAPPPNPPLTLRAEDDRDNEACDAIHPYLDELLRRFSAAGWLPAETCCAVFGWALLRMVDGAALASTPDAWAALDALPDQAREVIELEKARLSGSLPQIPGFHD